MQDSSVFMGEFDRMAGLSPQPWMITIRNSQGLWLVLAYIICLWTCMFYENGYLPFMGVQDIFTYQWLVCSYCPKVTFISFRFGVQSTDWFGDESGQSEIYKKITLTKATSLVFTVSNCLLTDSGYYVYSFFLASRFWTKISTYIGKVTKCEHFVCRLFKTRAIRTAWERAKLGKTLSDSH